MIELTGAEESLIEYVTDRPGHDRRYSLSSEKLRAELGWEAQVHFDEGLAEDRRLVPRERGVVGADPLRRLPRVLREAVREGARLMPERAADRCSRAWSCSSREVHGDERGFLVETFSRERWAELGVDAEFVQHNHSRSARGTLRGLHFQTEPGPGEAGALRRAARSSTSPSTCAATRRPTASGRATCSTTSPTASSSSRSASPTASSSSATSPTSPTRSPASTTRRPRRGSPGTTPTSASSGRSSDPLLSERDKTAPSLAEIAAELPF